MKRVVVISSHKPDPRLNKRIRSLQRIESDLYLIFWNRSFGSKFPGPELPEDQYTELFSSEPVNAILRLLETNRLSRVTLDILESLEPSLLYLSGIESTIPARTYQRRHVCKVVYELGDLPARRYIDKRSAIGKVIQASIKKRISAVDGLVVTSPFFLKYLSDQGYSCEKTFVFENVPERSSFASFSRKPHEDFRVGYVGSVRYFEQVKLLIEAASRVEGVTAYICGTGPSLRDVEAMNLRKKNVVITGPYDYSSIADIYSQIDIVYSVYPTNLINVTLALPNKLYEAIMCGLPIIVSKGTALAEYVEQLDIGFAVSDRDIDELQELIKLLKENRHVIEEKRAHSERLRNRFTYENIEHDFLNWISTFLYDLP